MRAYLHDSELVAPEARNRVCAAYAFAQAARHGLEQIISERMSEQVVDLLEMVEIKK